MVVGSGSESFDGEHDDQIQNPPNVDSSFSELRQKLIEVIKQQMEPTRLPENFMTFGPLGLTLHKTKSLSKMIEKKAYEEMSNQNRIEPERFKVSQVDASIIRIGSWERVSAAHEINLVAKSYFSNKKLVWEVWSVGAGLRKIEFPSSNITAIRAVIRENEQGVLEIELNQQPLFYKLSNTQQPGSHPVWVPTSDFTDNQATRCRRHCLTFPTGTLDKYYERLLQCDERLHILSREPFLSANSPFFMNCHYNTGTSLDFNVHVPNINHDESLLPPRSIPSPLVTKQLQPFEQTSQPLNNTNSTPPFSSIPSPLVTKQLQPLEQTSQPSNNTNSTPTPFWRIPLPLLTKQLQPFEQTSQQPLNNMNFDPLSIFPISAAEFLPDMFNIANYPQLSHYNDAAMWLHIPHPSVLNNVANQLFSESQPPISNDQIQPLNRGMLDDIQPQIQCGMYWKQDSITGLFADTNAPIQVATPMDYVHQLCDDTNPPNTSMDYGQYMTIHQLNTTEHPNPQHPMFEDTNPPSTSMDYGQYRTIHKLNTAEHPNPQHPIFDDTNPPSTSMDYGQSMTIHQLNTTEHPNPQHPMFDDTNPPSTSMDYGQCRTIDQLNTTEHPNPQHPMFDATNPPSTSMDYGQHRTIHQLNTTELPNPHHPLFDDTNPPSTSADYGQCMTTDQLNATELPNPNVTSSTNNSSDSFSFSFLDTLEFHYLFNDIDKVTTLDTIMGKS